MHYRIGRWVELLAQAVAILGGVMLLALTVMTVISIAGRQMIGLGLGPIPGDFELVAAGSAFAVCAFLPWTQLQRGHADVGIFSDHFPQKVNAAIDVVTEVLLFAIAVVLTWRLIYGLLDKQAYNETTFILQFPLWWGYAGCLVGLVTWIVVGAYCVWSALIAFVSGKDTRAGREAVH